MKMRSLLTLAGLAIGFAVPTIAQDKNAVDPQVRQEIEAALMKFDEAFNKHDAAAIAALYSPDAVQVWGWETGGAAVFGQRAIEKRYAIAVAGDMSDHVSKLVQVYAIGNEISAISEWSVAQWKGYAATIYVHDADKWKSRMEYATSSMTPSIDALVVKALPRHAIRN